MNKRDVLFLKEYARFSLKGPLIVAKCLYSSLLQAHANKDFDTVAHLQINLHAEMVLSLETIGALLLSFSKWDQPGGILKTLQTYSPGQVRTFLKKLFKSENALQMLCFPKREDLLTHCEDKDKKEIEETYNDENFLSLVKNICEMYLNEKVFIPYNKVKHGGLAIRDPRIFEDSLPKMNPGVFVFTSLDEKPFFFKVTGKPGLRTAKQYLINIEAITKIAQSLAKVFADFLEKKLLLSNNNGVGGKPQ